MRAIESLRVFALGRKFRILDVEKTWIFLSMLTRSLLLCFLYRKNSLASNILRRAQQRG